MIILRGTNRTVIFYCINLRRTKRIEREREREMVKKKKRSNGESQNTQCGNCYVITSTNEKTEMVRGW